MKSKNNLFPDKPMIYESPDKGKTVYARELGSLERTLVFEDKEAKRIQSRYNSLKQIAELAEHDSEIDTALTELELLYAKKKV